MIKNKILSIKNSDDSFWFKIEPNIGSFMSLDDIFNLSSNFNGVQIPEGLDYESLLSEFPTDIYIDEETCIAYIILKADCIHLILRKIRNYNSVRDNILDHFDFKRKFKPNE